jgi:L-ascorbate metabolism protein UlaG (beta-lactamase superfamily)
MLRLALALPMLLAGATAWADGTLTDSLRITYVGNEGFLIEADGKKVLIDALFRTSAPGYVSHAPTLRRQLEQASAPFDDVDVVLATHYHADHFDPRSVGSHLVNNKEGRFISTTQSQAELEASFPAWRHIRPRVTGCNPPEGVRETFEVDGIRVSAMNLHHGRERPIENLGFLVQIGDWTLLHIGDTEVSFEELAAQKLNEMDVDVFFVPYWYLAYSDWDGKIEPAVGNPTLIAMHMPPPEDPRGYLSELGGFDAAGSMIVSKYPGAIVPSSPMQSFSFGTE